MRTAYDPRDRGARWVRMTCMTLVAVGLSGLRADAQEPVVPTAADKVPTIASPAAGVTAVPATAPPAENKRFPQQVAWDNGLRFESTNDQFHLHLGGRAPVDSTWLIGPSSHFAPVGGSRNGVGNAAGTLLRRAVFQADGDIFGQFDYLVSYRR